MPRVWPLLGTTLSPAKQLAIRAVKALQALLGGVGGDRLLRHAEHPA